MRRGPKLAIGMALALGCLLALGGMIAHDGQGRGPVRFELDNGVRAVVTPIAGAGRVVVVAAYDTGYWDEPAGLPQLGHVVEHLRITAGVGDRPALAVRDELNAAGYVNGEALPHVTYYDMAGPPGSLGSLLAVEADRLGDLRPTPEDIAREAPLAGGEALWVSRAPGLPVVKFAAMAAPQAALHGLEHVRLIDGLGITLEHAKAALQAHYRADNLTLYIAGEVEPEDARALVQEHLGGLPAGRAREQRRFELPAGELRMTWDLPVAAAVVCFAPPADAAERLALTFALPIAFHQHFRGEAIQPVTSSQAWSMEAVPGKVVIGAPDAASARAAADRLHRILDGLADPGGLGQPVTLASLPFTMRFALGDGPLPADQLLAQAGQLAAAMNIDPEEARRRLIGQAALNAMVFDRLPGGRAERDAVRAMDAQAWRAVLSRAVPREARVTIIITPKGGEGP